MNMEFVITHEEFIAKLIKLCLKSGLKEFPKDSKAKSILLASFCIMLKKEEYTEQELNHELKNWTEYVCQIELFDFVTLRRILVDENYLFRTQDGSKYLLNRTVENLNIIREARSRNLDIIQIIEKAKADIEYKKAKYITYKEVKK